MAGLCTLAEAKLFLSVGTEHDIPLQKVIDEAAALMEARTNRLFVRRTVTNYRTAGRARTVLDPPVTPVDVTAPLTISVDGTAQTVWRSEADGAQAATDVVVTWAGKDPAWEPSLFYRASGWGTASHRSPMNVLLTMTGGFAEASAPPALRRIALEIVQRLWRDQTKGLTDVTAVNTSAGGVTLLDLILPRRSLDYLDSIRWVPE